MLELPDVLRAGQKLMELGFPRRQCARALHISHGDVERAAAWLADHSDSAPHNVSESDESGSEADEVSHIPSVAPGLVSADNEQVTRPPSQRNAPADDVCIFCTTVIIYCHPICHVVICYWQLNFVFISHIFLL